MKLIKFVLQLIVFLTIPLTIAILTLINQSYIPDGDNYPKELILSLRLVEAPLFIAFGYIADKFGEWFDSKLK